MDLAYDHIQEEALSPDEVAAKKAEQEKQPEGNLNTELQEAYKSFSASPWGARLGGLLNTVKKQGETYYEGARQEAGVVGEEAVKGFTDLKTTLVSRARSMSAGQQDQPKNVDPFSGDDEETTVSATTVEGAPKTKTDGEPPDKPRTESSILTSGSSDLISRFRSEATKRLADVQKAEDAADEALLRFGTNLSNFFKEAVTITAPIAHDDTSTKQGSKVLWESKAHDGKSVQHATRFEAQLHAIHSSYDSFTKDPVSDEYEPWAKDFDIEKKTEGISQDLETYRELREAMERLVPEKVDYGTFWMRYYFLRMVVDMEEQRRREMLKDATTPDAPLAWDDDSDSDSDASPTPQQRPQTAIPVTTQQSNDSTTTLQAPTTDQTSSQETSTTTAAPSASLKPTSNDIPSRRPSHDQTSQAGSDASYDIVSGATSRGLPSPKEGKDGKWKGGEDEEEEDEPDWE